MSKHPDLTCPRCNKPLNFLTQVKEWLEDMDAFGSIAKLRPQLFVNLWCDHCKDMTTSLWWEENDITKETKIPPLSEIGVELDTLVINYPSSRKDG